MRGEGGRFRSRRAWLVVQRKHYKEPWWREESREEVEILHYTETATVVRRQDASIEAVSYGKHAPWWDFKDRRQFIEMEGK